MNQEKQVRSKFHKYISETINANKTILTAIVCPTNYVIHIYSAYFGIQYLTPSLCDDSIVETPAKCYFPSVYTQINATCEAQNTCSLTSTSNSFSIADPCPNFAKQLFVQYQCVDYYTLNSSISQCNVNQTVPLICPALSIGSSIMEATACDTSYAPMNLTCQSGKKITILCAFYGLHPAIKGCALPNVCPVCYFGSSFSIVNATCSGQQSCSINFLNRFDDPCSGMNKALYTQYKCN